MSIARTQLDVIVESIVKREIKRGVLPSPELIARRLSELLAGRVLGQPTFKPRFAQRHQPSDPKAWNAMNDEWADDLTTIYTEANDQTRKILANFDYVEIEKRKIERALRQLDDRISSLLLLSSYTNGFFASVEDTFRDYTKVDLANTTALVDLVYDEVTPSPTAKGTSKLPLVDASITFSVAGDLERTTLSSLQNLLDDDETSAWLEKLVTTSTEVQGVLTISLPQGSSFKVNSLALAPHSSSALQVTAEYSRDNLNWVPLGTIYLDKPERLYFSPDNVMSIRLKLKKNTYDDVENGKYAYYLGMSNLSLFQCDYVDDSVFYSQPLVITDRQGRDIKVSRMALEVEDEVPSGTSISYYLAKYDPNSSLANQPWREIGPANRSANPDLAKVINHNNTVKKTKSVVGNTSMPSVQANGFDYYKVMEVDSPTTQSVVPESSKLYAGLDQWKSERYAASHPEPNYLASTSDWGDVTGTIITYYKDVESSAGVPSSDLLSQATGCHRLTTNIKMKDRATLSLPVSITGSISSLAIYLNNVEVFKKATQDGFAETVALTLGAGWNSVQLCLYVSDSTNAPGIAIGSASAGSLLSSGAITAEKCYCNGTDQLPMNRVDLTDLSYNVPLKAPDYYALSDDGTGIYLSEPNVESGLRYEWSYQCFLSGAEGSNKVIFKAALKRQNTTNVPRLKWYRIKAGI